MRRNSTNVILCGLATFDAILIVTSILMLRSVKSTRLKSLTGAFSKLKPRHNISLSQNKLYGAVEISMAVFLEKFIGEFF